MLLEYRKNENIIWTACYVNSACHGPVGQAPATSMWCLFFELVHCWPTVPSRRSLLSREIGSAERIPGEQWTRGAGDGDTENRSDVSLSHAPVGHQASCPVYGSSSRYVAIPNA